jgi:hypothetical protein
MKKIAKLSLVAAVAVVGMSNVNAASLEESIKGVDISGKVRYRMEEISNGQEDQDLNIDVKIKVPVNENVSFVANANYDDDTQEGAGTASDSSGTLDQYYFQYTNGAVTAMLGTQNIPGRLTDAEQGSGLVALYNFGNFTVGAASMYNNDISSEMLNSVIAMGTVGPVSLLGQYVDVDEVTAAYNLKADASVGPAMVGVEYSENDNDANSNELSTAKAYASAKLGMVSAKLAYAKTGDNGSGSLDTAAETPAELLLWQLGTAGQADMDMILVDGSIAVTPAISLRAAYADAEIGNTDVAETLGQISYKMSKNLNTYVRYSNYDNGTSDVQRGRLEVKYTF